ncbi:MAG: transcription antitermination factor NusB [Chloroflexi bacterium]|nr:transcription antitermination factor NusB [Chloroflexota bacterium]
MKREHGTGATDRVRSLRAGRRVALAAVFEADFGQRTPTAVLERDLAEVEADPGARELARRIVGAVVENRVGIDVRIEASAPQYPVVQLARMDRSLLRCALGEVLYSDTPARVAIAEWVELARIYSGDPMRRLMNGVLGRIARETEADTTPSSGGESQWPAPTIDSRKSSSSSSASTKRKSSPKPRSSTT